MRVDVGPAVADVLFVLAGFGVLNAAGFLRSSLWDVFAAIGLAFLAGVSFVMMAAIALLTLGVPFRLPLFVALSLATAVFGLLVRRDWLKMHPLRRPVVTDLGCTLRRTTIQAWIAAVTLVAFATYAVVGAVMARVRPLLEWDSWSIWTRKAEMLFYSGSLPSDFFTSSAYTFMHADYPLLVPVFESIHFRAMGTVDTQAIHLQFWLLLVAFVWAILYLGFRRGTLLVWLPIVSAFSIAPGVYGQTLTAYADIPMTLFLALGLLLLGDWLSMRDRTMLVLAVLFLAGSASTKNEGLMAAVVALLVAGAVLVIGRRRSDLRALGLGVAGFAAAILPWRVWISAHGIHGDIPFLNGLNPSHLADRADRVRPSLNALYMQLIDQTSWLYAVPFGIALALAYLLVVRQRSIAAFYLTTGVIVFAVLVWVYWIGPTVQPLGVYLATSAYRVVAVLAAIAFAALLQLASAVREA
jgi:hypothetical protein